MKIVFSLISCATPVSLCLSNDLKFQRVYTWFKRGVTVTPKPKNRLQLWVATIHMYVSYLNIH